MCDACIPSFGSLCAYGKAAVNQVGALLKGMIIRGNTRMYWSSLLSRKVLEALANTSEVVIPREHKRWDVSFLIQCGSVFWYNVVGKPTHPSSPPNVTTCYDNFKRSVQCNTHFVLRRTFDRHNCPR